ncbi:hypothetical protein SBOR_5439 [Sclerotinia borealis F-4128]|uniref:Uncharacterized protein n=1 Tax=Sclerotinia borealis (strain F-4128) TaxID=1432307 RepID=W9CE63_SCLBF|nr:hypothetical protein SBOR_5439 [Sclerotinia borealis F-4128]
MSDAEARMRKQQRSSEHTKNIADSEISKMPTKDDGDKESSQSSQSSKQPLLREREAEQAHEEDTAGCFCPILSHIPHFHWSKKKERALAGDQFAYGLWHNPREEIDESPNLGRKGCSDCKSLCDCPKNRVNVNVLKPGPMCYLYSTISKTNQSFNASQAVNWLDPKPGR